MIKRTEKKKSMNVRVSKPNHIMIVREGRYGDSFDDCLTSVLNDWVSAKQEIKQLQKELKSF